MILCIGQQGNRIVYKRQRKRIGVRWDSKMKLDEMKKLDINTVDSDELVDITSVSIDSSLPKIDKIKDFINQIKNPYCFKCEGTIVMVEFADEDRLMEDALLQYFKGKMEWTM